MYGTIAELWQVTIFKNGGHPPSWIFTDWNL